MANENKTVEQLCDYLANNDNSSGEPIRVAMPSLAKCILAAHKRDIADFQRRYDECVRRFNEADLERVRLREEVAAKDEEIAELRECLREAVEWSCGNPDENCEDCVAHGGDTTCKCEKWRKTLEGGTVVEIASLRALVKESIELLKNVNEVEFVDVTAWFDGCVDAEQQEWLDSAIDAIHKCQLAFDGIIAKAREM